jgi:hypothetical protein
MKLFPTGFLSILSLLLFTDAVFGQTTYYQQFDGESTRVAYQIYLNNVNNKLSGNLYYKLNNVDHEEKIGRIEFAGNFENDSIIRLRKFTEENTFASGEITNNQLKIIIQLSDSLIDTVDMKMQFYPGEIIFESISTAKTVKLLVRDDSPEATFEMALLVPGSGTSLFLRDLVLKFLNIYPDTVKSELIEPKVQVLAEQDNFLNDYLSLQSLFDSDGPSFNWFKTASTQVLYNSPHVFCIENAMYAFTGGAHGIENISYGIFSQFTDTKLQYSEIFKPDTQFILSNLITTSVKKTQEIPQDSSLPDYLYFVRKIDPNENIYLTPAGLGFYYNSYEIAPYSTGQTNVFFSFDELKGLLNKEFENMIAETKKE